MKWKRLALGNVTFWNPAVIIATWGGVGLLPRAPGTWGSLAALPFAWLFLSIGGRPALGGAAILVILAGVWAAGVYIRLSGAPDPRPVVVDEVAGQWLALLPAALDPLHFAIGFLLFRLFDIAKLWPVSWADRSLHGGLGVMLDDILAGAYAGFGLWLFIFLTRGG